MCVLDPLSAAVLTQLVEMGAGIRDKFDARAVELQVSEALLGSQISRGIHAELGESTQATIADNVANSAASSLLGHGVTGAPIEIQSIAANAVGSTVAGQIKNDIYLKQQSEKITSNPQKSSSSQTSLAPKTSSSQDMAEADVKGVNVNRATKWNKESNQRGSWKDKYLNDDFLSPSDM